MNIITAQHLTLLQKEAIIKLWNDEYPKSLKHDTVTSFDNYLDKLTGKTHFLLIEEFENILGWAVLFERDDADWFAIIIDKKLHGKGYGTILLNKLKEGKKLLNGWIIDANKALKENGEIYISPLQFYLKNGFVVIPAERFESEAMTAVKIQWSM